MTSIEIRHASGEIEERPLSKTEPLSIGNHPSNDICIEEEGVAAIHCRISWNKAAFEVTAAGPEGVDVNGTMVQHAVLLPNDLMRIGSIDIAVVDEDGDESVRQDEVKNDSGVVPLVPASSQNIPAWYRAPATDFHGDPKPKKDKDEEEAKQRKKKKKPRRHQEDHRDTEKRSSEENRAPDWADAARGDPELLNSDPVIPRSEQDAGHVPSEKTGKTWGALAEVQSRLKSKPVRPGERNITRSPLVMITFSGALVLLLSAATFWFMIGRDSVQRQYDAALKEMEEGRYTQAISMFEAFLVQYPRHSYTTPARVGLAKSRIEKEIVGSTPAWGRGLDALNEFIQKHRDLPTFVDQHAAIASYAETIALGAARRAERTKDRQPLEWANTATSFLVQYSPPKEPPVEAQEKIRIVVASAEATILKQETFTAAIDTIDVAIRDHDTIASLQARRHLLDRYADLIDDETLTARLQETLETEKSLVTREDFDQAALIVERQQPLPAPISLTFHTRARSDESSAGRTVFAIAKDCCYGIDTVTGDPLWRRVIGFDSPFFPIRVTTSVEAILLFDTNHAELALIGQKTGKTIWRQPVDENVSGPPLIHQGQAYLPTLGRHLYKIDIETGRVSAKLTFPRKVLSPPVLIADGEHLVVAADQGVLYTLSLRPLECILVSHLGQTPGSIQASMIKMGHLLLIAENDRTASCRLRVIDAEIAKTPLSQITETRIDGHVRDTPVIRGRQLFVPADGERIHAFTVSDDPQHRKLTPVAAYQVQSPYNGPIFLSVGPDGRLWMAGSSLRKFQLGTDSIQLDPKNIDIGISSQPLQSVGTNLFLGRQLPYSSAVTLSRTNRENMTSQWKTVLGSALIECIPAADKSSALCLNETGQLFVVGAEELQNGGFRHRANVDLKPSDLLQQPLRVSHLGDGRLAVHCDQPEPRLWIIDTQGQLEREIKLVQPLEANPILLADKIVLPLPGRLKLVAFNPDSPATEDFLAPVGKEQKSRWTQLSVLAQNQFIVADSKHRLRRIQFRSEPVSHLAEVSSIDLPRAVDVDFLVANGRILLADAGRRFMLLNASDFEVLSEIELDAPASNSPWQVDGKFYLETGRNQLQCFQFDQKLTKLWSVPLKSGSLAGRPLSSGTNLVLAQQNGTIITVNSETGDVLSRVELGQPIRIGPRRIGKHIVVVSVDGSLHRVESMDGGAK